MPQQGIAFRNGAIDASFLPEPFLQQAINSGTVVSIAPASKLRDDDVTGVILYSDHLIQERPQVAGRMMKAYIRGLREYVGALKSARLAGPGAEDIIDIISRYSIVKDKTVLRSIIPHYVDPNGAVGAASLQKDWEFYKAHGFIEGDVTVSQLIDPSWALAAVGDLGPYTGRSP
jgi:NitT/TauT family transport system substrate-binding protein